MSARHPLTFRFISSMGTDFRIDSVHVYPYFGEFRNLAWDLIEHLGLPGGAFRHLEQEEPVTNK